MSENLRRLFSVLLSFMALAFKSAIAFAKETLHEALMSFRRAWPKLSEAVRFAAHARPPMAHLKGVWKALLANMKAVKANARANLLSIGYAPMLSIDRAAGRA